jgi:predicted TIM-barrel fold metal-dependent hydrolase
VGFSRRLNARALTPVFRIRFWLLYLAALLQVPSHADVRPRADYHQHLFSPSVCALAGISPPILAKDLIGLLDDAGIDKGVVLSLAYQYGNPNRPPVDNEYEKVKAENDWTSHQVAQYPERLRAFCSINPLKDYALAEIDRCAKDPLLRSGLKLHFGNSDVDLGNAEHVAQLRRVFTTANHHGMAILVHMRSSVTRKRPYGADRARVFLEDVLPAAPDVSIVIAHLTGAGGYDDPLVDEALGVFVEAIAKQDARVARLYFDVSGVAGLGNWRDHASQVAARIREIGVGRVLYGSDGAGAGNLTPREAWAAFRALPLSNQEFSTIASNVAPFMR